MKEQIEELTLLLLYLTSWEEEEIPKTMRRSWKGHSFQALHALVEKDYLRGGVKSKSVYITENGIEQAKQLLKKYIENDGKEEE